MAKAKQKPATARGPRKVPKTKTNAPGAPGIGHNKPALTPDQVRELFARHRNFWNIWQNKKKLVQDSEREMKAALKADGFTVKQMQIADALQTERGEVKITDEVNDRLKVARWIGHPMGRQLDLFEHPDRIPITDRAYEEGKQASIDNQPATPAYAPETEAYRAYMQGYHAHQRELAGGFKAPAEQQSTLN